MRCVPSVRAGQGASRLGAGIAAGVLVAAAPLALGPLAGCSSMEKAFAGAQKPGVTVKGVRLADLALDSATLNFDVDVSNPYSVPLPLTDVAYSLASGKTAPFLTGSANLAGTIPAGGAKTFTVPAKVSFASLMSTVSGVRPGAVVPYDAKLDFSVDVPNVPGVTPGKLSLPVSKSGQVPVPAVPEVSVESVNWRDVSLTGAKGELALNIKNTNQFPVDLSSLNYALQLGGKDVASASVAQGAKFGPGQTQGIRIPFDVSAAQAGMGLLEMVRGGRSGYRFAGNAAFGTPFGPVSLPLNADGQTTLKR